MGIFPLQQHPHGDGDVAYVSPLLAFNIGLHGSAFDVLLQGGKDGLEPLFSPEGGASDRRAAVFVELSPLSQVPSYASHLRISFVRVPECSLLEPLRGSSPTEAEDRQKLIDSSLSDYFRADRFLARGDVFGVHLNWSCRSELCVACRRRRRRRPAAADLIYFKVCGSMGWCCS